MKPAPVVRRILVLPLVLVAGACTQEVATAPDRGAPPPALKKEAAITPLPSYTLLAGCAIDGVGTKKECSDAYDAVVQHFLDLDNACIAAVSVSDKAPYLEEQSWMLTDGLISTVLEWEADKVPFGTSVICGSIGNEDNTRIAFYDATFAEISRLDLFTGTTAVFRMALVTRFCNFKSGKCGLEYEVPAAFTLYPSTEFALCPDGQTDCDAIQAAPVAECTLLPCGFQVLGRYHGDAALLAVVHLVVDNAFSTLEVVVRRPQVTFAMAPEIWEGYVPRPYGYPGQDHFGALSCPMSIVATVDGGIAKVLKWKIRHLDNADGYQYGNVYTLNPGPSPTQWWAPLTAPTTTLSTHTWVPGVIASSMMAARYPVDLTAHVTAEVDYGDGIVDEVPVGTPRCAVPPAQDMDATVQLVSWYADTNVEEAGTAADGTPLYRFTHSCSAHFTVAVTGGRGFVVHDFDGSASESWFNATTGAFLGGFVYAPHTVNFARLSWFAPISGDVFPLAINWSTGLSAPKVVRYQYVAPSRQISGIQGRWVVPVYTSDGRRFTLTANAPCAPQS